MSYEVDDWYMSYDSSDSTGNSKLLNITDIYIENDGIKVEYNFSNAGCGAVDFEINVAGESHRMSSSSNNFDGSYTFTDLQLVEDEYTVTANVISAADCDDDLVFLSDQFNVVVSATDDGSGGDGGSDELTLSDLDYDCDISRSSVTEGESVVVDVSIDGFAPSSTGPWTVPIDVVADGRVVAQGSGSVSVNGSSGESFDVEFYDTGTYNIEVDLYQPYE